MKFIRFNRDIPFMSWRRAGAFIFIMTLIQAIFLLPRSLNLGIDFTGGSVLEVSYSQTADLDKIRTILADLEMFDTSVQNFGTSRDVLIRLSIKPNLSSAQLSETVLSALKQDDPSVEIHRVEFVGSQVGDELLENGFLALLFLSLGIVLSINAL